MFQVVLPLELALTLLYWVFFYTQGSLHWNQTETYVHPMFLYITPSLLLIVEASLNQVMYEYSNLKWVILIYCCYLPLTYFGKFALGYYPYQFITWTTLYSYFMVISLGLLIIGSFLGVASLNNRLKRDQMEKNAQIEHL